MWYFVNSVLKRISDIIISLLLLLFLFPFLIIIAILIKCDSKGPVFFLQERRTKNGRIFKMIKFRSMVVNAESMDAGIFNFANDNRVTKFGQWLRSNSIDELPQLINVIKGDLSIVGPRPSVTYELGDFDTLNKRYMKRFSIRGGITGLAQIKGRNEITWDKKVDYDNLYIEMFKRQGIWIDIKILFETFKKVVTKNGIYEEKVDSDLNSHEAAELQEREIIRIAHLKDDE